MVEAMRRKGDKDGADVWLRIIVAIGTPGEPPTEGAALKQRADWIVGERLGAVEHRTQ